MSSLCLAAQDDARLEECLPVITALAFRLQESHAIMMALHDQQQQVDKDLGGDATLETDFVNTSFVTRQLLEIALLADYGDEIGRRKMFTLIRELSYDLLNYSSQS